MYEKRIERTMEKLEDMGLSQMLIVDPMSIFYFTGVYISPFERFFGLYISKDKENVLFLNKLFTIPDNIEIKKVWYTDTDPVTDIISEYIDKDKVLGVDKELKARFLLPLMEKNHAKGFVNSSIAVDITRGIKDREEIEKMRLASKINDEAMAQFKGLIHENVTEKEVADKMLDIYLKLGADGYSFTPIVSFGANAADPHHEPDDTVLKEGDCVLFDVGCIKDGYCSDMTRTFYYKKVNDHAKKIYELVQKANEEAEKIIAPGKEIHILDDTARKIISDAGYGPQFNHRLGHFIGLAEHEYGDVSSTNDWELKAGMIFSIEPGIYLEKDTGVRIEDLVLVTPDGVERLNNYPKDLEIIG
ncbi:Xaa-Pro dipeptidase [Acetitomaculum ruminis DSM 5522]|uniref:Xaa-Pro dipeptidase n=1 Tax=Acetitomaculum ruminis DSM 5522 TaxID=1120918 RepID=A0A1I0ZVK9_9FIRM|nr:Xaa-Pro peptidase family protein [Acetitomaculum ruminis]SFB29785.1 Xaa-Pro dipeptidase [Acetitomaculum ruminis DSM 5522]